MSIMKLVNCKDLPSVCLASDGCDGNRRYKKSSQSDVGVFIYY